MKKVLLFIFLFLFSFKVQAKTYYSDYSSYIETDSYIESSDIVEVEEITKYQDYIDKEVYEYLENSDNIFTGNISITRGDYVYNPELLEQDRTIKKIYSYTYKKSVYDTINIINNNDSVLDIKLSLYDKRNGTFYFDKVEYVLNSNDSINIELNNNLGYLCLLIEAEDEINNLSISILKDDNEVLLESSTSNYAYIVDFDKYDIFTNTYITEESFNEPYSIPYIIYYFNEYILYEYKHIEREYLDTYSLEGDINYPKTYYRYRTREKAIVEDDIIIKDKETSLLDFINYDGNIDITSDVNYNINGMYTINYILPFTTITKDIKVDIESNYIDLINSQVEYINALENSVDIANYLVDKKNSEIKEIITLEEDNNNNLIEELNSCYKELEELKENKISLGNEKEVKKQSISYIAILLITLGFLIILKVKN